MDAAVIGPGRVGTLLALALRRAGHRLVAVSGGTEAARTQLVSLVAGARTLDDPADAVGRAQLVVLAVPDDAIAEVVTSLALADAFEPGHRVLHVAGSRGLDVLERASLAGASIAACHPAATVPPGAHDPALLHGVAWAVTARPSARAWAHALVGDLGGDPYDLPDDRRALYHAALATGSNAVAAAAALARRLLLASGIEAPQRFLGPLAEASLANVLGRGAEAITGPIARGDVGTIAQHLEALDADVPELAAAYRAFALGTLTQVRAGLDPVAVDALATQLDDAATPGAAEG